MLVAMEDLDVLQIIFRVVGIGALIVGAWGFKVATRPDSLKASPRDDCSYPTIFAWAIFWGIIGICCS